MTTRTPDPLLFVYGSLLTAIAHPKGERLRREGKLVSTASVSGRLYRVSWYPGLIDPSAADEIVHGEVYALPDADRSLIWLDAYEGIIRDGSSVVKTGEIERVERSATLADGTVRRVQLYLWRGSLSGAEHLPSGRWPEHAGPLPPNAD